MMQTVLSAPVPLPDALVIDAARRWRNAKDLGLPVQPALHAMLEPAGYGMLTPAFDSVMRLCESHFDRPLCTGCPLAAPSADEHLLCRLLADPSLLERARPCRAGRMDRAFGCALRSVRIMLALDRPHRPGQADG